MNAIEQRVDFVGCHHMEDSDGMSVYSDANTTNNLLSEKLEVLDSKGFEVVSVVPVISGRGVTTLVQKPQSNDGDIFSRLIQFLGSSRKQRKKAKKNPAQGNSQSVEVTGMGYSYTQGFTIFSKRKKNA